MANRKILEICEGEIIDVREELSVYNSIFYICNVILPNGNIARLNNVVQASQFGGIGNYVQYRARTRKDQGSEPDANEVFKPGNIDSYIGEKVYISFIGGNMREPVIIAFKQHPSQRPEFSSPQELTRPVYTRQVNGVRETISQFGTWRLQRRGAPTESFVPNGIGGAGLGGTSTNNWVTMEAYGQGIFRVRDPKGGMFELDNVEKKGVYISTNDYTSFEALFEEDPPGSDTFVKKEPESEGLIEVEEDVDTGTGTLSGGIVTDAEFLWMNREKKFVVLHSRQDMVFHTGRNREEFIDGERYVHVESNDTARILGNKKETISGGYKRTVGGYTELEHLDFYINIAQEGFVFTSDNGGFTSVLKNDFFVSIDGGVVEMNLSANGIMKVDFDDVVQFLGADGGKVEINSDGALHLGNDSINLLKIVKILALNIEQLATAIKTHTHTGNLFFPTAPPDPATIGVMTGVETIAKQKQEETETITG